MRNTPTPFKNDYEPGRSTCISFPCVAQRVRSVILLDNMKTANSLSGGMTSSYIAAKYPADYNVFALVRIEDQDNRFPDKAVRRQVEDRLQAPFIGTAEDDTIIYTMLDLEQYLGREIKWVTGKTFEQVIQDKGGFLPNDYTRYCTTHLKLEPICYWWLTTIGEPIEMRIGFRANETDRAERTLASTNKDGLNEFKLSVEMRQNKNGKWYNKNRVVAWRKPVFPLLHDNIYRTEIKKFWQDKPVRFAKFNNCVGCMNQNPLLLRKRFEWDAQKMQWFINQEEKTGSQWLSGQSYKQIKSRALQSEIGFEDFTPCDGGYCEVA